MNYPGEAEIELLQKGALVDFTISAQQIQTTPGGDDTYVCLELLLGEPEDGDADERTRDHEWGGLGFAFCVQMLSFIDGRPRGSSEPDFVAGDAFTVFDLVRHFRYEDGELHVSTDYLRGRCMKTDVVIRRNGTATITTRNRGEAVLRWLDRMEGKKMLELMV